MSAAAIRFHGLTLSFLHGRRERRLSQMARRLRVRLSRRTTRRLIRSLLP